MRSQSSCEGDTYVTVVISIYCRWQEHEPSPMKSVRHKWCWLMKATIYAAVINCRGVTFPKWTGNPMMSLKFLITRPRSVRFTICPIALIIPSFFLCLTFGPEMFKVYYCIWIWIYVAWFWFQKGSFTVKRLSRISIYMLDIGLMTAADTKIIGTLQLGWTYFIYEMAWAYGSWGKNIMLGMWSVLHGLMW